MKVSNTMTNLCFYIFTISYIYLTCAYAHVKDSNQIFMNQFAVRIDGGKEAAERIASKHGFVMLGEIGSLKDYYLFEHHRIAKRSISHSRDHHSLLENDPEVGWFQQQVELKRRKRDIFDEFRNFPLSSSSYLRSQFLPYASTFSFPDPLYNEQWYLHGGAAGGNDMNVVKAWQNGYTGRGIVVSILDDGIQTNHPDLVLNYDRFASTDINGNDDDPMPQDNGDNKHGTRCAGEVAATAYNGICGVGIAYNASIGGVRMLDGTVNDAVEARALSHNPGHVDIYSASWGPEDDGKTVDGPGTLAKQAFIDGVNKGRKGKGSIFVWASGNGGRHEDNCNCDGYTNSIYTLSISSATQHGQKPWYLEECSSTLATTYSSGTPGQDQSVVTVDMALNGEQMCTKEHTGTSASAPIAAAICALALEANPNLTWRDMQYLVVLTSKSTPLEKDGWITNGVNRKVSHKFGYGLMDAGAMTELAEQWRPVPPQNICEMPPDSMERVIPNDFGASVEFYLDTDGCFDTHRAVNYLEHVQAKISLNFSPRGNLRIILQSPFGTSSTLLFPRPRDMYKSTFEDWPFLSVHFWGERPAGRWRLTIINAGTKVAVQPGVLKRWSLVFYGTETDPLRSNALPTTPMGFMPFAASSMSYSSLLPKLGINRRNNQSRENYKLTSKNCHEECLGGCYGTGSDECAACQHLVMHSGSKKICVRECADGWFAVPKQECCRCDLSCQTCSGESSKDCITCQSNLLLLREGDVTKCTAVCPFGYYKAPIDRSCNPCSSLCTRCEGGPERCTKCREGLVLYNKTCMAACPRMTYKDGQGRCAACYPSCATCIGPNPVDCVTCPPHLFHLNGTCVPSCPFGFYHLKWGNECYSCNPTCESCNAEKCSSCFKGWALDSMGRCQPSADIICPNGTYLDVVKCLPCHISCQACTGSSYSQCTACLNKMFLYKNICVSECPGGYYHISLGMCMPCHETCKKCDDEGPDMCTVCNEGLHLEDGHCISGCPVGYFSDSGQCLPCSPNCKICRSSNKTECNSCISGTSLIGGSCQLSCALGYFRHVNSCVPCHRSCHTCKGIGLSDCLSCTQDHVLDGGLCMECGRSQYYDPIIEKCNMCNITCTTCNGPDAYSCLSCTLPLKHDPLLHRCVPCCNRQLTSNCCHCDPHTDTCILLPSANKRKTEEDAAGFYMQRKDQYHMTSVNHQVLVIVIGSCLLIVVVFFLIFGILQARSNEFVYSSSSGYQPLPTQYNCELENAILEKFDMEEEENLLSTNT